jgi:UDP-glucose 4-epimerase
MSGGGETTVLVTGACGGLGRVLVRRLLAGPGFRVIGLDRRNWVLDRPTRFVFEQVDLRKGRAEDVLRVHRPRWLVHLAFADVSAPRAERHATNVLGTQKLLEWALRWGVERIAVLSRAAVYGARPENPSLITEDMPLQLAAESSDMQDLVEFDHLCRSWLWEHREVAMSLLRPVHLVGPNIREGLLHRWLSQDPVPTAIGFDPMVQVVHEDDVVQAIERVLGAGARGLWNVDGPGQIPLSVLLRELGRRTRPLPHPVLAAWDRLAYRLGISGLPPRAIDFLRFSCLVDASRIRRELGYAPIWGLAATLRAVPPPGAAIVA